jgi:hypothetical protein
MTMSGFSVEQLRQFISFWKIKNASYLYIYEGATRFGRKNNHLIEN